MSSPHLKQIHEKPPSKKLSLKERRFSVTLSIPGTNQPVLFPVRDGQQVFSQALRGELQLDASNGMELSIRWTHPDLDALPSLSTLERHGQERNDIRRIDMSLIRKHVLKHIDRFHVENSVGCVEARGMNRDQGGYLRVNLDYQWFRFTHVLMRYFHGQSVHDTAHHIGLQPSEVDCSHLCGNAWCCNVEHLHFEKHMARNACHSSGTCSSHRPACILEGDNMASSDGAV